MKDKRHRRGIKIQFVVSTLILKNVFGFDAMTEKLEEVYFKNVNMLFFYNDLSVNVQSFYLFIIPAPNPVMLSYAMLSQRFDLNICSVFYCTTFTWCD